MQLLFKVTTVQILYTMNSFMYRPNMWSHGWPKHVAVCYVYKPVTIYVCKCVGSINLHYQLNHGSCIISYVVISQQTKVVCVTTARQ